jgi:hypothetical protein
MQQQLEPKLAAKTLGAISRKTPVKIYRVFFWGLMQSLRAKDWEVSIERLNLELVAATSTFVLSIKGLGSIFLIELKASEKQEDIARDANNALQQIIDKNYQNPVGLPNMCTLREYGIARFHLSSCINGRYLELNSQNQRVEKDDPTMSVS